MNLRQSGATLLVALIMLVLMTLAAITSFNLGRSNLLVVGNQQHRSEAEASVKAAMEDVVSKTYFATAPTTPFGSTNSKSYDVNGDNTNDVTVTVGSSGSATNPVPCIKSYTKLSQLSPTDTSVLGCVSSAQQQFGVEGTTPYVLNCADIVWEVTAVATDTATQASVTAVQGINIRQDENETKNTANYCN